MSDNPDGMHADLKTGDFSNPRLNAFDFMLPPSGKATSTIVGFKLKVIPKTGLFTGTHPNPTVGGRPLPFVGILLQDQVAFTGGFGLSKDANVPYYLDLQPGPGGP